VKLQLVTNETALLTGCPEQPNIKAVIQGILLFYVGRLLLKQFTGVGNAPTTSPSFDARAHALADGAAFNPIPQLVTPLWASNTSLDISIYVSPSVSMPRLEDAPEGSLVLAEKDFRIDNWEDARQISTSFAVPESVQKNNTLWAHFYASISGSVLDPRDEAYDTSKAYHFIRPLTQYLAKKQVKKDKEATGRLRRCARRR
jgi:hypothetical protein